MGSSHFSQQWQENSEEQDENSFLSKTHFYQSIRFSFGKVHSLQNTILKTNQMLNSFQTTFIKYLNRLRIVVQFFENLPVYSQSVCLLLLAFHVLLVRIVGLRKMFIINKWRHTLMKADIQGHSENKITDNHTNPSKQENTRMKIRNTQQVYLVNIKLLYLTTGVPFKKAFIFCTLYVKTKLSGKNLVLKGTWRSL